MNQNLTESEAGASTKNYEPRTTNFSSKTISLDCMGLPCPGPIGRLSDAMSAAAVGDLVAVRASDPGFHRDMEAWCRARGHELLEVRPIPGGIEARVRKNAPAPATAVAASSGRHKKTFVVFSGDLDRVMAALVLANGALSLGDEVTLFFTFWGLAALRKEQHVPTTGKTVMDKMFGFMLPRGLNKLTLSKMNMGGMGTAMMKRVMKQKQVASLPQLMAESQQKGIKMVVCSMSMDVMGLRKEELLDGVEIGGAAAFLTEANESNVTLFV